MLCATTSDLPIVQQAMWVHPGPEQAREVTLQLIAPKGMELPGFVVAKDLVAAARASGGEMLPFAEHLV
ncbi:MAG: hypothetical protein ACRD21_12440 [Vicinamibacteria bacterium]